MNVKQGVLPVDFDERGLLPPGEYEVSFEELRKSLLVRGPRTPVPHWNEEWRWYLTQQAETLVDQLWAVGIRDVYLDGSFVEDKPKPNDIDGYFVCDVGPLADGSLTRALNLLDPRKVWTWDPRSRKPYHGYTKRQLPMWHAYRVELYPHWGQSSGICDQFGNELQFPSAFRQRRGTCEPKGIVKIRLPPREP
ncbi:MAG TPA: hypothetical protein VFJ82_11600 [Longimicrobium sp.]|nr:hypothetical protein [Longimicrobium sp.]